MTDRRHILLTLRARSGDRGALNLLLTELREDEAVRAWSLAIRRREAALGTGAETELLVPVLDAVDAYCTPATIITADAGCHSETNLRTLAARQRPALIADRDRRRRDARFATQGRHKPAREVLHDKRPKGASGRYQPRDFACDPIARTCVCPAGESRDRKARDLVVRGFSARSSAAPSATASRAHIARVGR